MHLLSGRGFALPSPVAFPCLALLGCAGTWSDPAIPDSEDREAPAHTNVEALQHGMETSQGCFVIPRLHFEEWRDSTFLWVWKD